MLVKKTSEYYEARATQSKNRLIVLLICVQVLSIIVGTIVFVKQYYFDYLDPAENVSVRQFLFCLVLVLYGFYSILFRTISFALYFGIKNGIKDISVQLYYVHDEKPVYLKLLRMIHIWCFAAAGFLSYQMRDSLILADNVKYYKFMTNQTYLPKNSDNMEPLKAFVNAFCETCQQTCPNEIIEVTISGDFYHCKACGQPISLELEVNEDWFADRLQAVNFHVATRTRLDSRPWAINASMA